jgi:hypothetical protein
VSARLLWQGVARSRRQLVRPRDDRNALLKPDGGAAEAMMRTLWIKIFMAIDENIPDDLPAVVIWRIVFAIVMLALVLFVNWRLWLSSSHL